MYLSPTFYFRPLITPITLSHYYNITLRNPSLEELPIFTQSIQILSKRLSDKERRRILYTLYPLGNFTSEGSLEEQFTRELSRIWILAHTDKELPFEQGLIDYGFLCGYYSDNSYTRNPGGFIGDINTLSPRELFRALKKELPKAAKTIIDNSYDTIPDIKHLIDQASYWDGILAKDTHLPQFIQLAKTLRLAHNYTDTTQKLLQYCIAVEILLVNNHSKISLSKQFSIKLALIRHYMIQLKKEHHLSSPLANQELFNQLYKIRSQLIHGQDRNKITKKTIAYYINTLYPTLRLGMELQAIDPCFIEFINKI